MENQVWYLVSLLHQDKASSVECILSNTSSPKHKYSNVIDQYYEVCCSKEHMIPVSRQVSNRWTRIYIHLKVFRRYKRGNLKGKLSKLVYLVTKWGFKKTFTNRSWVAFAFWDFQYDFLTHAWNGTSKVLFTTAFNSCKCISRPCLTSFASSWSNSSLFAIS